MYSVLFWFKKPHRLPKVSSDLINVILIDKKVVLKIHFGSKNLHGLPKWHSEVGEFLLHFCVFFFEKLSFRRASINRNCRIKSNAWIKLTGLIVVKSVTQIAILWTKTNTGKNEKTVTYFAWTYQHMFSTICQNINSEVIFRHCLFYSIFFVLKQKGFTEEHWPVGTNGFRYVVHKCCESFVNSFFFRNSIYDLCCPKNKKIHLDEINYVR